MAYNHCEAEKDWKEHVKKRKQELKAVGCPEEWIEKVIALDRKDFNKERSFLEHEDITEEGYFINYPVYTTQEINTIEKSPTMKQSEFLPKVRHFDEDFCKAGEDLCNNPLKFWGTHWMMKTIVNERL